MVKVSKGQKQFNFVTDLDKLLMAGPGHLNLMGLGYGGFSWWHHLGALMLVACLSDLEVALGRYSWRKYKTHVDEFEALRHIRNAYVHAASDLSKIDDPNGLSTVQTFHRKLTSGQVKGDKGNTIAPYFSLNGSIVKLEKSTIRRARALYLTVLIAAGEVTP